LRRRVYAVWLGEFGIPRKPGGYSYRPRPINFNSVHDVPAVPPFILNIQPSG
jgi:hypothetical protein